MFLDDTRIDRPIPFFFTELIVAEFIRIKQVYTFSSIRDHTIPKRLKCSNSVTKRDKHQVSDCHRIIGLLHLLLVTSE